MQLMNTEIVMGNCLGQHLDPLNASRCEMKLNEFYEEIKDILDYFHLRFNDMDKVNIHFEDGKVIYEYSNITVIRDHSGE
jgi:hypothetical protein